jgi:predicted RNA-binding protein with PUA-like domain
MPSELEERIQWFREEYLDTPAGQKHLATTEAEPREVQKVFAEIREKDQAGGDITDDVLQRLLPHTDSEYHRKNEHRISTWPCINKDVRAWFEGAGWKQPEDWPQTARLVFEAIGGIVGGNKAAWDRFLSSKYRRGFGTGFISPILFCLDDQRFPVINSKVIKTYKYCTEQLGDPDEVDATLAHYLQNAKKVQELQKRLTPLGLRTIREFDIFCHYMVSKRLGGGDLTKTKEPEYTGWLFVARPDRFRWQQAFDENGVEWTGSLGAHAQKLLQRQVRAGDRAFGYQAGPDYEICCEMRIATDPYKTPKGTWATRLQPIKRFERAVSLSTLKSHPILSSMGFVRQSQLSISGITAEQLTILDELLSGPNVIPGTSPIDQLCQRLTEAQYDTSSPDRFEALLAEAFEFLGFEADHVGGSGTPDVTVVGRLGSDTYTATIEAKTCRQGKVVGLPQIDYVSIRDHREAYTADHALLIAPAFAGGKVESRAVKDSVGMMTTEGLLSLLRLHDQFPFGIGELRRLFEGRGLMGEIESELKRLHHRHYGHIQLASTVLQIFDELQRQQEVSEPIPSSAIYLLLLGRARQDEMAPADRTEIDHVLSLLSNPVLDVLDREDDGYVLTISPAAARKRLLALADLVTAEE